MIVRRSIPFSMVGCVLAAATPLSAQQVDEPEIVYHEVEVVQPLPGAPAPQAHGADSHPGDVPAAEPRIAPAPLPGYDSPVAPAHHRHHPRAHHAPPPPMVPPHAYPSQAVLDQGSWHDAWLAECRDRLQGGRSRDDGRVGGGIIGSILGGVIGNRVARGDRLAGTLIGAGVGGLAGVAVGPRRTPAPGGCRPKPACACSSTG
ncbi:hypothetical protein J4558_02185 [Leptolyngbya sp. 15MV]|nr:hypothetical protein J4558_02185 [Leptolyngbya sp. 15MV]